MIHKRRITRQGFSVVAAAIGIVAAATAQTPAPQADPSDFGLVVPVGGALRAGEGRRVAIQHGGARVVALVHTDVGDRRIVVLPNGRLSSLPLDQTKATRDDFIPATKEQVVAELKGKALPGFKSRTTGRYVYLYNTSEEFWKTTSRILETMYPAITAYFKRLKLPVHEPTTPLVVIMFRTEEEFQKYHAMPSGVVAYYNAVSNHVVMFEQSKLIEVAPDLAVKQSIATIAHEGIHQILHNIGVQQRLSTWPMWISEGLPEYFAPTSTDKRLRWKGVGTVNDLRMYELEQFVKHGGGERENIVEQTVQAARLTSTGYAAAWALTHFLARTKKEKFEDYLLEVSKIGPLEQIGAKNTYLQRLGGGGSELFARHFGADYRKLENQLIEHLKQLPYTDPIANQTHYVVMLDTAMQRTAGVTTSPAAVRKWKDESLQNVPPQLRARASFQVLAFPNKRLAEQYAQQWLHRN